VGGREGVAGAGDREANVVPPGPGPVPPAAPARGPEVGGMTPVDELTTVLARVRIRLAREAREAKG
jgi:hypothetical protein